MPIEPNASLMIRYLLRQLNERARNELEEAYVLDEATFEALCATEDLLIDSYLQHKLRWRQRRRFEKYYLASPAHRQRMDDARKLMDAVSGDARDFSPRAGRPRLLVLIATGVLLAVVMLIPWLLFLRERAETGAMKAKSLHVQPGRPASMGARVAYVSLEPGIPKSSDPSSGRIAFSRETDIVHIELLLPRTPAYGRYRVTLQRPDGSEAFRESLLLPPSSSKGSAVVFLAPGTLLTETDYLVVVEGERSGRFTYLASYALAIQWR